ncbi:hypothetical protein, partial [Arhodomonas sp. AD133]|uniref:hypothetical protein n=1 Tax=Arhodomonas sp. AD133 TaxID=3415009 RepID=UPI003EBE5F86
MLKGFETILLDMNDTFMFGHDRFGDEQNYGAYFTSIGGTLSADDATVIIRRVLEYLEPLYPDPASRECFPGIEAAVAAVSLKGSVSEADRMRLVETFAHHERGTVPPAYLSGPRRLHRPVTICIMDGSRGDACV